MKRAVVDRQSATIKILQDGSVVRELPFRIISDDTIIVGNKLFSGPPRDFRKWEEEGRHERGMNGWNMKEGDRLTFMPTLPVRPLCFKAIGPRGVYRRRREFLFRQLNDARLVEELAAEIRAGRSALLYYLLEAADGERKEFFTELLDLELKEAHRKKMACLQSRRKRPPKAERKKFKKKASVESGSSEKSGGKKKSKKSKAKDNTGARGEKSGNRKDQQK